MAESTPDPPTRLVEALAERYRIERELGEGGMATVYLAEDRKHSRKVALKVLKPELAAVVGAERFLAEIDTTANLQHPHILPLFDSGEAAGFLYFVMPYVEGETLQDRILRETQLPVEEAVRFTQAVAQALQTAHNAGVVHRDIKPANILLSRGEPLVADFGIALAVGAAGGSRLTETGLSVGTPYYMSPEQATGDQSVGPRTDVYSLACVLYEMLVGEPPFVGNTAQAVLGKILQGDVKPVRESRRSVPRNVDAALRKALERLPADRFARADDFARALGDPGFRYGDPGGAPNGSAARLWRAVAMGAATVAAASLALAGWAIGRPDGSGYVPLNVVVEMPQGEDFVGYGSFDLAPDGAFVVYQGPSEDGPRRLWRRNLTELTGAPIPGTESGVLPDISPDGTEVAFQSAGFPVRQIRIASLTGGGARTVVDSAWCCAQWGEDGLIYYTDLDRSLSRVDPRGGVRERLIPPPEGRNTWVPFPFASGRRVVQSVAGAGSEASSIQGIDLETRDTMFVTVGMDPTVTPWGDLLYVTDNQELVAVPFDGEALEVTGPPVVLARDLVDTGDQVGHYSVSARGDMLAYRRRPFGGAGMLLHWLDGGTPEVVDPDWEVDFPYNVGGLALSPTGDRLALAFNSDGQSDVRVKQLPDGASFRLSFSDAADGRPSWTPDGRYVTFLSMRSGTSQIYRRRADGAGETELVHQDREGVEEATWSPDGAWLVYRTNQFGRRAGDIFGIRPGIDSESRVLISTEFEERHPDISPDGRWMAYASNESGRFEVFLVPFPDTDRVRIPVSPRGGWSPRWGPDGRTLFYISGDEYGPVGLVRVELDLAPPYAHRETVVSRSEDVDAWDLEEATDYDVHPGTGRPIGLLSPYWETEPEFVVVQGLRERIRALREGAR